VAELLRARPDQMPAISNTSATAINPANITNASGYTNLTSHVAHPSTATEIKSGTKKHTQSKSVRPVLDLICRAMLTSMSLLCIFNETP